MVLNCNPDIQCIPDCVANTGNPLRFTFQIVQHLNDKCVHVTSMQCSNELKRVIIPNHPNNIWHM